MSRYALINYIPDHAPGEGFCWVVVSQTLDGVDQSASSSPLEVVANPPWRERVANKDLCYLEGLLADWSDINAIDADSLFKLIANLSIGVLRVGRRGTASPEQLKEIISAAFSLAS